MKYTIPISLFLVAWKFAWLAYFAPTTGNQLSMPELFSGLASIFLFFTSLALLISFLVKDFGE